MTVFYVAGYVNGGRGKFFMERVVLMIEAGENYFGAGCFGRGDSFLCNGLCQWRQVKVFYGAGGVVDRSR